MASEERNSHIFTHFKQKKCLTTEKLLLYIADEWFELHINQSCASGKCGYEMISDPVVHIDDQLIKKEGNDSNCKCVLNDATNIKYEDGDSFDIPFKNDTEMNFDSMSSTASESSLTKLETRRKKDKSKTKLKKGSSEKKLKKTLEKRAEEPPATKSVRQYIEAKTKTTKCRICKQKVSQKMLIHHLQQRHVPKTLDVPTCGTCGKTFSTPGNLRLHQHLHAERGRYICSYCGKEFYRNANLKEHLNLHTVSLTNFLSNTPNNFFIL